MKEIQISAKGIMIGGEYKVLLCASLFYFRLPIEQWQDRIDKIIRAGYNCIDVYFPWNFHEIEKNVWDFEEDKDADLFLKMCSDSGLYIIARPGPYICSEWDGGALPSRTVDLGIRTYADSFLSEVKVWFDKILPIIKKHEYNGKSGVIFTQLENELDFFDCKNVDKYITALKEMALSYDLKSPLFCCAGQLSAEKAGGLTDGIIPTYNFYPDSRDNTYDGVMRNINDALEKMNLPLMVTETNRDHFLLRRELASGAKLLGAYNQVAGSNFGFTSSVNNWGNPLSFISTQYDFGSLITSLGEYSDEVGNAIVLGKFISAMGEKLGGAKSLKEDIDFKSEFTTTEKLNALKLADGGVVVNIPSFSEQTGNITVTYNNKSITAKIKPFTAPFLPFDVIIGENVIECANCEICGINDGEIVFHYDFEPYAVINGKIFKGDGKIGDTKIRFIKDREAEEIESNSIRHNIIDIKEIEIIEGAPKFISVDTSKGLDFNALNIPRGYVLYEAETEIGKKVFVENACDIITADAEDFTDTQIGKGSCIVYPIPKGGKIKLRVEKWGNSNFDDSRYKSMLLSSHKGISGIYSVMEQHELNYFKFTLLEKFMEENIQMDKSALAPILNVSKWNTTRLPSVCAYSTVVIRKQDKMYVYIDSDVENAVYIDGKFVSRGDYKYVDLTEYTALGKEVELTIVYRKAHWAVNCGYVSVLQLKKAIIKAKKLTDKMLDLLEVGQGEKVELPYKVEKGKQYLAKTTLNTDKCCYIETDLTDLKITFVINKRVAARMIGSGDQAPIIKGGSETLFYIPKQWIEKDNILKIYIECMGENPKINKLSIVEKNS